MATDTDLLLYQFNEADETHWMTARNAFEAMEIYAKMFGREAAEAIESLAPLRPSKRIMFENDEGEMVKKTVKEWIETNPELFMTTAR